MRWDAEEKGRTVLATGDASPYYEAPIAVQIVGRSLTGGENLTIVKEAGRL